jgi:hypothetical protein
MRINSIKYKNDLNLNFYIEKQNLYLNIINNIGNHIINNIELSFFSFGYCKDNFEKETEIVTNMCNKSYENDFFIFNELDFYY